MFLISKRFVALGFLLISFLLAGTQAIAKEAALYFDFNSIPAHQLTDKIDMRFVTSSQFTVIRVLPVSVLDSYKLSS